MDKSEELEKSIRMKLLEYAERPEIQSQLTEAFYIWLDNPDSIQQYSSEEDLDDELFSRFYDWFLFDYRTLGNNNRVIENFYKDSNENLDKEESDVVKDWAKSTQSYFEIKEIKKGELCIIKDLFSGTEIVVHDTAVSSNVRLNDLISGRPLNTAGKHFFSGLVSIYPFIFKPLLTDYFKKEYKRYKTKNGIEKTPSDYLKDFGYLIGKYIEDVINHPRFLTADGEEFVIAKSEYRINDKAGLIETLNSDKNLKLITDLEDDLVMFNFERLDDKSLDAYMDIFNNSLTINCNSLKKLGIIKEYLEEKLKDYISHKEDSSRDFSNFTDTRQPASFKLPKGYRSRKKFNSELDEYYSSWVDLPLEKLGGLSPREALATAEGRKKLERVLTELEKLYDDARKAGEPYFDVEKLRKELQNTMN